MAVVLTARFRVSNWRALRRLSDETLIHYAHAAGARRYLLFRNAHDAAEALLLVEAPSLDALRPLCDILLRRETARNGGLVPDSGGGPAPGRLWEPSGCRSIG
jgi:predicted xylose isomerase-like sugar epimerase